jgi:hypothetical protein
LILTYTFCFLLILFEIESNHFSPTFPFEPQARGGLRLSKASVGCREVWQLLFLLLLLLPTCFLASAALPNTYVPSLDFNTDKDKPTLICKLCMIQMNVPSLDTRNDSPNYVHQRLKLFVCLLWRGSWGYLTIAQIRKFAGKAVSPKQGTPTHTYNIYYMYIYI